YEREALVTNDRERLGALVGEIEKLHVRLGTPDSAIRWVQRWITAAPEEPEALRALARLYDRRGHEARLIATLDALARLLAPADPHQRRGALARAIAALVPAESESNGADLGERIDTRLSRTRRHEELAQRLAQRAAARGRGPAAAALDLRRAAILKDDLHRPE